MNNRIKFLAAAGLVLLIAMIFAGCSTEDPWNPTRTGQFDLSLISGPADSVAVPLGNVISYSWAASGGSGSVQYQYRVDTLAWFPLSRTTFVTLHGLAEGVHTFSVRAQDAGGASDEVSAVFRVEDQAVPPDADAPTVTIIESPLEGTFVAVGSTISFTWEGSDTTAGDNLLYRYYFAGDTSDWAPARTVTFTNVAAADTAVFTVWAMDPIGNVSEPVTVTFFIKNATILYIDDFQWVDPFQEVDRTKERDQKRFYREALNGYAVAEWDVATQGVPTAADLAPYSTILWANDAAIGTTSTTWYDPAVQGVVAGYFAGGGNAILTGSLLLYDFKTDAAGDYLPTLPTDFDYQWLGVDSSAHETDSTWWLGGVPSDTAIVDPDSITTQEVYTSIPWDYWDDFTWAVKDSATTLAIPDSMKLDVGKNGDQIDYACEVHNLRNDAAVTTEVLYRWGLTITNEPAAAYLQPIGHINRFGGVARTALLNFDTYSMPLPEMTQVFQQVLEQLGE